MKTIIQHNKLRLATAVGTGSLLMCLTMGFLRAEPLDEFLIESEDELIKFTLSRDTDTNAFLISVQIDGEIFPVVSTSNVLMASDVSYKILDVRIDGNAFTMAGFSFSENGLIPTLWCARGSVDADISEDLIAILQPFLRGDEKWQFKSLKVVAQSRLKLVDLNGMEHDLDWKPTRDWEELKAQGEISEGQFLAYTISGELFFDGVPYPDPNDMGLLKIDPPTESQ